MWLGMLQVVRKTTLVLSDLHFFMFSLTANMPHCISPTKKNSQIIVFAAASAAEMPPLEPICETESFYQAALPTESEPVQTQAADLSDHLEQVSGWTNDL